MTNNYYPESPTSIGLDWFIKKRDTSKYCRIFKKNGSGRCTLPPNVYKKIIRLLGSDMTYQEIADEVSVHKNTIINVKNRLKEGTHLKFNTRGLTGKYTPRHTAKHYKATEKLKNK